MSRRFTATEKWQDGWFLDLSIEHKLVWVYLLDTCSNAGRWIKNIKMLNFCCESPMTETALLDIFQGRIIDRGDYFFIPKFLRFQYPSGLMSNKPVIESVRNELKKYGLWDMVDSIYSNDNAIIPLSLPNDTSIGIGIGIGQRKGKSSIRPRTPARNTVALKKPSFDFDAVWNSYPKREGRKPAEKHFRASVLSEADYNDLKNAIENYKRQIAAEVRDKQYIKMGSTFFNNWRDYVDAGYSAPKRSPREQAVIDAAAKRDAERAAEEAAFARLSPAEQERRKQAAAEMLRSIGEK